MGKPALCFHYPGEDPDGDTIRAPEPDKALHKVKTYPAKDAAILWRKRVRLAQFFAGAIPIGIAGFIAHHFSHKWYPIPTPEEAVEEARKAAAGEVDSDEESESESGSS